jgi:hypothetical protein
MGSPKAHVTQTPTRTIRYTSGAWDSTSMAQVIGSVLSLTNLSCADSHTGEDAGFLDDPLLELTSGMIANPGHLLRPVTSIGKEISGHISACPRVPGQGMLKELLKGTIWYHRRSHKHTRGETYGLGEYAHRLPPRWLFLGPDIPNGLSGGRSNAWSRQKLMRKFNEDTEYVCWICNSGTHWYLTVADVPSGTLHIFNSLGSTGNHVATKFVQSFLQYLGSFDDSYIGSTWGVILQHSPQQHNGYDCGPFTIANCLRVVSAWDRFQQVTFPPMPDFRLRVCLLVASSPSGTIWRGLC